MRQKGAYVENTSRAISMPVVQRERYQRVLQLQVQQRERERRAMASGAVLPPMPPIEYPELDDEAVAADGDDLPPM